MPFLIMNSHWALNVEVDRGMLRYSNFRLATSVFWILLIYSTCSVAQLERQYLAAEVPKGSYCQDSRGCSMEAEVSLLTFVDGTVGVSVSEGNVSPIQYFNLSKEASTFIIAPENTPKFPLSGTVIRSVGGTQFAANSPYFEVHGTGKIRPLVSLTWIEPSPSILTRGTAERITKGSGVTTVSTVEVNPITGCLFEAVGATQIVDNEGLLSYKEKLDAEFAKTSRCVAAFSEERRRNRGSALIVDGKVTNTTSASVVALPLVDGCRPRLKSKYESASGLISTYSANQPDDSSQIDVRDFVASETPKVYGFGVYRVAGSSVRESGLLILGEPESSIGCPTELHLKRYDLTKQLRIVAGAAVRSEPTAVSTSDIPDVALLATVQRLLAKNEERTETSFWFASIPRFPGNSVSLDGPAATLQFERKNGALLLAGEVVSLAYDSRGWWVARTIEAVDKGVQPPVFLQRIFVVSRVKKSQNTMR
jgi:hypothetical protein